MNQPSNSGKSWGEDEKRLIREYKRGKTVEELAVMFDRPEWGVASKLNRCGFSIKGRWESHRKPQKRNKVIRSKVVPDRQKTWFTRLRGLFC